MIRPPAESDFSPVLFLLLFTSIFSCDLEVLPDDFSTGPDTETPTYEALDPSRGGARGLTLLSNGGLLLTGNTEGAVYLQRTDAEGNVTLDRSYPASGNDNANDVLQLSDGTYVVAGTTINPVSFETEALYLRTRPDGEVLIGPLNLPFPNSNEFVTKVIELADGSVLMMGSATDITTDNTNLYLLRCSPDLSTRHFQITVPLPDTETARDAIALNDGFVVVGNLRPDGGDWEGLFARFDMDGNLLEGQPRRFKLTGGIADFWDISKIDEGTFVTSGIASLTGNVDVIVLKTDANGTAEAGYPKIFGEEQDEFVFSSQSTADGGLILAGQEESDALLLKLDASFNEVWRVVSGVSSDDGFNRVATMPDGGYAVGGFRGSSLYYAKTNGQGRVE